MNTADFLHQVAKIEDRIFFLASNIEPPGGLLPAVDHLRAGGVITDEIAMKIKLLWHERNKIVNAASKAESGVVHSSDSLSLVSVALGISL